MQHPLAVEIKDARRSFGNVVALDGVNLEIRAGEFFSLLGPSGCGKTTLLRIIAGLDALDGGALKIVGAEVEKTPAHQRPVNTVFQSYALFPHMTVGDNIAFGLRMKKISAAQIKERVTRVMGLVKIEELGARFPGEISGGQKQRVALARALVNEPKVLLLDEPLGALDLKLRKELQVELHQIQRRLGTTFICVTHDQEEALVMSHRVAVMNAGRIEQLDTPQTLYERPRTRFVAQFLGSCNLIAGRVAASSPESLLVQTPVGDLRVRRQPDARQLAAGSPATLSVRPEKLALQAGCAAAPPNEFCARIEEVIYNGAETQYRLRHAEQEFSAVLLNAGHTSNGFKLGDDVCVRVSPEALVLLDD